MWATYFPSSVSTHKTGLAFGMSYGNILLSSATNIVNQGGHQNRYVIIIVCVVVSFLQSLEKFRHKFFWMPLIIHMVLIAKAYQVCFRVWFGNMSRDTKLIWENVVYI